MRIFWRKKNCSKSPSNRGTYRIIYIHRSSTVQFVLSHYTLASPIIQFAAKSLGGRLGAEGNVYKSISARCIHWAFPRKPPSGNNFSSPASSSPISRRLMHKLCLPTFWQEFGLPASFVIGTAENGISKRVIGRVGKPWSDRIFQGFFS